MNTTTDLQRNPNSRPLADALIEGYLTKRILDLEAMDLFLALRACTYIGWIITRCEEPGGEERCTRFIKTGCLYVERWLNDSQGAG